MYKNVVAGILIDVYIFCTNCGPILIIDRAPSEPQNVRINMMMMMMIIITIMKNYRNYNGGDNDNNDSNSINNNNNNNNNSFNQFLCNNSS